MLPQCLFTVEAITTTTRTLAKAKKKAAKGKVAHGKRYSDAVKSRVIEFVNQINSEKGRGGISAAAKKCGASPLSISNWVKKGRSTVKAAVAKAGSRPRSGSRDNILHELTSLNRTITKRRRELDELEARFAKLKAALW